ncbi:MAG: SDR family NAD(P)-dependent oxidoreductase [Simkaniaceae bacterium]
MNCEKIKTALITGATSEIALHVGERLANFNTKLILTAKDQSQLYEIAQILRKKTEVITHLGDLKEPKTCQELTALMNEQDIDLLINNAGIGLYGPALMHSTKEQLSILDINARATLELTLSAARFMKNKQKKGVILNISSAASFFSYPTFCVYSASKAFVTNFSLGFDKEMAPFGIRILTACPGQIETAFRLKAAKNYPQHPTKQALSPSKASKLILKQIQKEKRLYIFDWRYRFALFLSRWLIPDIIIEKILKKSICDRYPDKKY